MKLPQNREFGQRIGVNIVLSFFSVFIAVLSAFALNNWNDNRKNHNAEEKILTEILKGLEKDLEDLKNNETGHKRGLRATVLFQDLLDNKAMPKDSLMIHYSNLTRDFISIQNTSGYETLKSRGLELIKNDDLRSKIISLYEYDYEILRKLEEEYYESQFQENYFKDINDLVAKNLEFDDNKEVSGITIPINITANEEKVFLTYLWKIKRNRTFILNYYPKVIAKIESIRQEIETEINQ
jgi:glutaredoxin-related protein